MAELVEGTSGHATYAPLSHSSTTSMGRHLQDQIRQLQQAFSSLGKDMGESNQAITDLRKAVAGAGGELSHINDRLQHTTTTVEKQGNEAARAAAVAAKVQKSLEGAKNNVAELMDAKKVSDTLMVKMQKDITKQAERQHEFQETIEKRVEADIRSLRDDFGKSELRVAQLKADFESARRELNDEKEQLRLAYVGLKEAQERMNDMDTFAKILEQRVADGAAGLKSTRAELEALNTTTVKLQEDYDNTKAKVGDQHRGIKRVEGYVKQVHSGLEESKLAINTAHEKLARHAISGETLTQSVEDARARIQSVHEGNDRANNTIADLTKQLADTDANTRAVRAGLKESNSILLPNLQLDSSEVRGASQRHGSLLRTANINAASPSLASPRKTPRASGRPATLTPASLA